MEHNGYVYLLACAPYNTFKIGWSDNPKKRFASLKAANPSLIFLFCFPANRRIENWLHQQFIEDRTFGREWYNIQPDKLTRFLVAMIAFAQINCWFFDKPIYTCEEFRPLVETVVRIANQPNVRKSLMRFVCGSR